MSEFEFIEGIRRAFAGVGDGGITGIGDDCAVLPAGDGEAFVVTTDMLVEDVHFLRRATSPRELGAKSLAVNLSDVAAMGARPVASLLSIALPPECRGEWAAEFMEGYREMSLRHGVRLAGGDTTASKKAVAINVVAIGCAPPGRLKYRSGARTGDIVAVNGVLGESAAGLRDILEGRLDTALAAVHRNPVPQVAEGKWLGARPEVHSMIDLSDGLASDLGHILRASGVAARIDLDTIPTPVSTELAMTGGEDYKLLLTVAPEEFARLTEDYRAKFGSPLNPVGRITESRAEAPKEEALPDPSVETDGNKIVWLENGKPVTKNWRGFVHF